MRVIVQCKGRRYRNWLPITWDWHFCFGQVRMQFRNSILVTFYRTAQRDGRIGMVIGVSRVLELPDRFYEAKRKSGDMEARFATK